MKIDPEYLTPYLISNAVALIMLILTWLKPNISRVFYILLFAWASVTNSITAIKTPEVYLEYTEYTLSNVYTNFINGIFSEHITTLVLCIAFCQFAIAILLFKKGNLLNLGLLAGILFFIGIAPLGVGSAFPSSLIWALGLYMLYRKKLDVLKIKSLLQ